MDLRSLLDTELWGITVTQLATAIGVAVLLTFVLRTVLNVLLRRIRKFASRTESDLDDLAVELLDKTRTLLIAVVALWAASRPLPLGSQVEQGVRAVLVIGLLVQGGLWGMGTINYLLRRWSHRQQADDPGIATAVGVVGFVARFGLWSVLLLTALGTLGINIGPFIASLGIGGVAVALALQNVLGDLLASLSIILDKPFVVGDFIVVGADAGSVEHVGLKTTRIRSISGEQLVLSNSDILSARIRNYGRMAERRIVFAIGVEYGTSTEALRAIPTMVRETVEACDHTRFDRCHLKDFGDSALNFETVYYMQVPDYGVYMDTQQEINLRLYERFEQEGIAFAFPTQTLHLIEAAPPAAAEGGR